MSGHYIGLDLLTLSWVSSLQLTVDNSSIFRSAAEFVHLQASLDGEEWMTLSKHCYSISVATSNRSPQIVRYSFHRPEAATALRVVFDGKSHTDSLHSIKVYEVTYSRDQSDTLNYHRTTISVPPPASSAPAKTSLLFILGDPLSASLISPQTQQMLALAEFLAQQPLTEVTIPSPQGYIVN